LTQRHNHFVELRTGRAECDVGAQAPAGPILRSDDQRVRRSHLDLLLMRHCCAKGCANAPAARTSQFRLRRSLCVAQPVALSIERGVHECVMNRNLVKSARNAVPVHGTGTEELKTFLRALHERDAAQLKSTGFAAREGELALLTDDTGKLSGAVLGLGKSKDTLSLAAFSEQLPAGTY